MPSRSETQKRKSDLERYLRDLTQSEPAKRGFRLPAHRELAERFGVSTHTVFRTVRQLQNEGVLFSAAGVGVYARRPPESDRIFCFLDWEGQGERFLQLHAGFSAELANAGFLSAVLIGQDAADWAATEGRQLVSGVFATYRPSNAERFLDVPHVGFYQHSLPNWDQLTFADESGGWLASHHMMECGHRSQAFVGCPQLNQDPIHCWSERRRLGWQRAIAEAGTSYRGIVVAPEHEDTESHHKIGYRAAHRILACDHCTGVVTANSHIAAGLFQALIDSSAPRSRWPSIVSFQDSDLLDLPNVSQVTLDYNAFGREAARSLIERYTKALVGPPILREAPVRLVPSLTSHPGWALRASSSLVKIR